MMLGGDNILLSGPCFQPSHLIVCQFADGKLSNGSYIDENRAVKCSIYLTSRMLECQVDGCSVLTTLKSKPQAVILKVGVEQHFTRVLFRRGVGNQG